MTSLEFEMLKQRIQYFDPIAIIYKNGIRKEGQFLSSHDKDNETFGFLNVETDKKEIIKISDVRIDVL